VKTDCNGRYVYLNPRRGGQIAVAESARNVACTGATPVAITNCLNFGNPYKPGVYWQFKEAVAGIGEACRVFNTPVTGGNVSFYNESPVASVYPTPVIGMLGILEEVRKACRASFASEDDAILLLGSTHGHLGGSAYLATVHDRIQGDAPAIDLNEEKALHVALTAMIGAGLLSSAHDCSEGGLAVALAESCIVGQPSLMGARVSLEPSGLRWDQVLFGEDQSRVIVSCHREKEESVKGIARKNGIRATRIGTTGGTRLTIGEKVDADLKALARVYFGSIEEQMRSPT